jgi:hypothetical protein
MTGKRADPVLRLTDAELIAAFHGLLLPASRWIHALCESCWAAREHRTPPRITDAEAEVCCACQTSTTSGIYIRANPATLRCTHGADERPNDTGLGP